MAGTLASGKDIFPMQSQSNEFSRIPDLERRVTAVERRVDTLERIEHRLERVEEAVVELRTDFNGFRGEFATYRSENGAVLERILATLQELQQRPLIGFRWPWESRA